MRVRKSLVLGGCGLLVGALAVIVYAQGTQVDVDRNGVHVQAGAKAVGRTNAPVVRSKDILGLKVTNSSDESLGKIEDIVIDPAAGKIRYAVVSFGGMLGIGNKLFAVPWGKLAFVPKGTTSSGTEKEAYCLLNLSKDVLKNAPGFDKSDWPNFADSNWNATVDQFYGQRRSASGARSPQR
jgi:sporulation protein YlmC with PRC-barrel domain